jgi:hypothetical protein
MKRDSFTVGYLPKGYPRISETFILNEIWTLEQLGLDIRIFPLKRPEGDARQSTASQVVAPVRYLPEKIVLWLPLLLAVHLGLAAAAAARLRADAALHAVALLAASAARRRCGASSRPAGWPGWSLRGTSIRHFHAHFCHGPATVAMFTKWLTGIPFSFTGPRQGSLPHRARDLRDKMREPSSCLTCTRYNKQYLDSVRRRPDASPPHLSRPRLEPLRSRRTRAHRAARNRVRNPAGCRCCCRSVGWSRRRAFDTLIRAARCCANQGVRFAASSTATDRGATRSPRWCRSLELEGIVEMPGAILQDDLIEIYRQATLFALPCQVSTTATATGCRTSS